MKNEAELISDEWILTTSSKRKSKLIKQTKELFEQGLIKIPKQEMMIFEGTRWIPPPW